MPFLVGFEWWSVSNGTEIILCISLSFRFCIIIWIIWSHNFGVLLFYCIVHFSSSSKANVFFASGHLSQLVVPLPFCGIIFALLWEFCYFALLLSVAIFHLHRILPSPFKLHTVFRGSGIYFVHFLVHLYHPACILLLVATCLCRSYTICSHFFLHFLPYLCRKILKLSGKSFPLFAGQ